MGSKYISTSTGTQIDDAVNKRHTHANKTILDSTTATFTTEWEALLAVVQAGLVTTDNVTTITNKVMDDITNYIGANHIHYRCRNNTDVTILAGTVVTMEGTQTGTDYLEIVPFTDPTTQIAVGITHSDIVKNSVGLVINTGVMNDHVDTTPWTEGTILYPNDAGGFTNIKPSEGQYQPCAVVTRSHQNQGTLLVEFTAPKNIASTTKAGEVQLNDTLTSTSVTEALTSNQGRILKELIDSVAGNVGTKSVDETDIKNGSILVYDAVLDKVVYTDVIDSGSIV